MSESTLGKICCEDGCERKAIDAGIRCGLCGLERVKQLGAGEQE